MNKIVQLWISFVLWRYIKLIEFVVWWIDCMCSCECYFRLEKKNSLRCIRLKRNKKIVEVHKILKHFRRKSNSDYCSVETVSSCRAVISCIQSRTCWKCDDFAKTKWTQPKKITNKKVSENSTKTNICDRALLKTLR